MARHSSVYPFKKSLNKKKSGQDLPVISEAWRQWIATNLLQNVPEATLADILKQNGADDRVILHTINQIKNEASFQAAQQLAQVLHKRDWLLKTLDQMQRHHSQYGHVPRVHQPTQEWFYNNAWSASQPVILTGMLDEWPILSRWTGQYLNDHYGHVEIAVQCGKAAGQQISGIHNPAFMRTMPFSTIIDWVENPNPRNELDFYVAGYNDKFNQKALEGLLQEVPDLPGLFANQVKPTFWYGPKGAVTPVHHDGSNNMLIQIRGRKKIQLVSAFQHPFMYGRDDYYSYVDLDNIDYDTYPLMKNVTIMEAIIEPGDMIFFPVGWYHQVTLLEPCISLASTDFLKPNSYPVSP